MNRLGVAIADQTISPAVAYLRAGLQLLVFVVSGVSLWCAFDKWKKLATGRGRNRFALKWIGIGVILLVLNYFAFVVLALPVLHQQERVKAEQVTINALQKRLGKRPDKVSFEWKDQKTTYNGWVWPGTAEVAGTIWDVTVTLSQDVNQKETFDFEATNRPSPESASTNPKQTIRSSGVQRP